MARKLWYTVVQAPFGRLYITGSDTVIESIDLHPPTVTRSLCDNIPLLKQTAYAVETYLNGNIQHIETPNHLPLSPFQQAVFRVVKSIPYGKTVTYRDIADAIGKPSAVRAVMHTCLSNPLWLVFPAHRAILSKAVTPCNDRFWDASSVLRSLEQRYLDKS